MLEFELSGTACNFNLEFKVLSNFNPVRSNLARLQTGEILLHSSSINLFDGMGLSCISIVKSKLFFWIHHTLASTSTQT
uniref:Uncharacterized protein n=1 Tax=Manihot esculenta TaxID=3983 RepID=A0A2C9W5A5_MANES